MNTVHQTALLNPAIVFVNMDQTSLQYEMIPTHTIQVTGSKTVPIERSIPDSSITAVLSISSQGEKLAPYLIDKGPAEGRIVREFYCKDSAYLNEMHYATSPTAWINAALMDDWIRTVLRP